MTAPIEDVASLPGKTVYDQTQSEVGKVEAIYATGNGFPMWIEVRARERSVFVPLARMKDEDGNVLVPYSRAHVLRSPEIDAADGISAEDDAHLRGFYAVGAADQEMWQDNFSYATLVENEIGESHRVNNPEELGTPSADKRTDETRARLEDPGNAEPRHFTLGGSESENDEEAHGASDG
jgi:hypothetical protein